MIITLHNTLNFDKKLIVEIGLTADVSYSSFVGFGVDYPFVAFTDSKRILKKIADLYSVDEIEFVITDYDEGSEKYTLDTLEDYRYKITGHVHFNKFLDLSKIMRSIAEDLSPVVRLKK